MHIYLVIYFLGTIPFMFTFSLSAKCNSLPCFSEGTSEIASELVACLKPLSGSVSHQQSSLNGGQVLFCVSFQQKQKNAGWEKNFKTNELEQSLPS